MGSDGLDVDAVVAVLAVVEGLVERLPTEVFTDDRLRVRAESLVEVLEGGLAWHRSLFGTDAARTGEGRPSSHARRGGGSGRM